VQCDPGIGEWLRESEVHSIGASVHGHQESSARSRVSLPNGQFGGTAWALHTQWSETAGSMVGNCWFDGRKLLVRWSKTAGSALGVGEHDAGSARKVHHSVGEGGG